jgi:hypothetical protein
LALGLDHKGNKAMITKTAMVVRVLAKGKICRGINGMIIRLGRTYLAYDCQNERVWFYCHKIRKELKGWIVGKMATIHSFKQEVPF